MARSEAQGPGGFKSPAHRVSERHREPSARLDVVEVPWACIF